MIDYHSIIIKYKTLLFRLSIACVDAFLRQPGILHILLAYVGYILFTSR